MNAQKLNTGQKHILRLIARDKKSDGWATVSATLIKTLKENIPSELVTFESTGDAGRAKLTTAGQGVVDAMVWLGG